LQSSGGNQTTIPIVILKMLNLEQELFIIPSPAITGEGKNYFK
jgi:hypothetical protein